MTFSLELTDTQAAALAYVAGKQQAEPLEYLGARVNDILESYVQKIIADRLQDNEALIRATLGLPESTRDEIKAFIASKLPQPAS